MSKKLFVGGLDWSMNDDELGQLFAQFGVAEAKVITDRDTGRSRGFGFVTLSDASQLQAAVQELDGSEQGGRTISVSEAKDKPRQSGGGAPRGNRSFDRGGRR